MAIGGLLACARLLSAPAHATDLCLLSGHVRSRGLGLYTVDARANVGGSQNILGLHPMDCSCDALYGDTGLLRSSMRRKFAGMTNVSTPPRALDQVCSDFSYTGRRSAGRPKVELIDAEFAEGCPRQIALNIADVSAPAGQQPVRRMARRPRHHLLLWPA
jgi:hypothetical protein